MHYENFTFSLWLALALYRSLLAEHKVMRLSWKNWIYELCTVYGCTHTTSNYGNLEACGINWHLTLCSDWISRGFFFSYSLYLPLCLYFIWIGKFRWQWLHTFALAGCQDEKHGLMRYEEKSSAMSCVTAHAISNRLNDGEKIQQDLHFSVFLLKFQSLFL